MRAHSTDSRRALIPSEAARSSASSGRAQKSQATPDGATRPIRSQVAQLLAGWPVAL